MFYLEPRIWKSVKGKFNTPYESTVRSKESFQKYTQGALLLKKSHFFCSSFHSDVIQKGYTLQIGPHKARGHYVQMISSIINANDSLLSSILYFSNKQTGGTVLKWMKFYTLKASFIISRGPNNGFEWLEWLHFQGPPSWQVEGENTIKGKC